MQVKRPPSINSSYTLLHFPPLCVLQSMSMTPLQMLRAALHTLCDPVAGLPKGMSMTHQSPEQLLATARAAAPSLLFPAHPQGERLSAMLVCPFVRA